MSYLNFITQRLKSLDNSSKRNLFIVGTIILTIFLLYFKYKSFEDEFHLSMVPDGLNVSEILYVNESTFGLGPGGNETGLIVYELSDKVSAEVQKNGVAYFANMPPNQGENRRWRGDYGHWSSTPVISEKILKTSDPDKNTPPPSSALKISNYLDQYGFGLKIDPSIENKVDGALSKSGSYIGYGRVGILIVAPEIKRVFYAYAG